MHTFVRNLVLVLAFAMVASLPAWSQTAGLTGTVTDPTGAVVPGAKVTITNEAIGVSRSTTTASDGGYIFPQLAPATYKVEVMAQGFKTAIREHVRVLVGLTSTLDVHLEMGAVAETVTVEAEVAAINITDATVGTVLTQVGNFPMEGRDAAGLLSLQAGAVFIPTANSNTAFDSRSGSINGSRSDQTSITLDGVDNNDPQFGRAYEGALRSTLDSIQEFRITTTNANADMGRSSAAQVQLVTRSGTNEIHGSAYWSHRNTATSANEYFIKRSQLQSGEPNKPPRLQKHIFGGRGGGPVIKNRLFIFGNYEERRDIREESALRNVPSWAMRNGFIQYECDDPTDARCAGGPVTIAGRTLNVQPGFFVMTPAQLAAIDPLGIGPGPATLTWFQQYPEGNDPAGGFDGVNIWGFRFAAPIKNTFRTMIVRADYNIDRDGKHQLFWRGNLQDDVLNRAPQFPGEPPNSKFLGDSWGMALGYKALLSPNVVNNFRYGLIRIKEATQGLQTRTFINFRFLSNLEGFHTDTFGRTLPQHFLGDDLNWTRGKHTLSFGGTVRLTRNSKFSNGNSFHFFTSNPSWVPGEGSNVTPGDGDCNRPACSAVPAVSSGFRETFHDVVINTMGLITQATANYNFDRTGATLAEGDPIPRRFATNEYELYLQDQWRATTSLTVTFGARYILISPPWETNGNQVTPTPNLDEWFRIREAFMKAGVPSNQAPVINFDLGGPANGRPGYYPWDYNNWSPRVAAAWAPHYKEGILGKIFGDGKLVIRAGYALVYDRIGNALVTQFDDIGSFGMSTSIDSTFGGCDEGADTAPAICPRFAGDVFAVPTSFLPPSPGGRFPTTPPRGDEPGGFAITTALDGSIVTPYSHTMNVFVARTLPKDFSVEVGYVGRRGRKLLVQRDLAMPLNLVDPISGMDYFTAATLLVKQIEQGVPISAVQNIPYWENMYPTWATVGGRGLTNTQEAYRRFSFAEPDYTFALFRMDVTCPDPIRRIPCSRFGPFAYFNDQYGALSAWSSTGRSEYHGLQIIARKRLSSGTAFDFNYTFSKSLDHTSEAEYAGAYGGLDTGGTTGFLVNSWTPDIWYAPSDFDTRHQVNANWYVELPFGKGKLLGRDVSGWLDQIIGGWQFSGLFRVTSGLPATVGNGRAWPTNWNITGNATCIAKCPATATTKNAPLPDGSGGTGPNIFADPLAAFDAIRRSRPGEAGDRNVLRGDGYFGIDTALAKRFHLPLEGHGLLFRWEVFNLTNSVRFDTGSLNMNLGAQGAFGNYTNVIGPADGAARIMQFSLRYEF